MYKKLFETFPRAIAQTQLAQQTYRALPITLNYSRPEDRHVLVHVQPEDLTLDSEDFMFKFLEPALCDLSSKIFSKGKPVGFYDMYLPKGMAFAERWVSDGLIVRVVMVFDLLSNDYIIRFDARPEYDEEVIARLDSKS